jgi:hypothetical protein
MIYVGGNKMKISSLPLSGVTLGMVVVVLIGLCMYTDLPMNVYHFVTMPMSSDVKDEGWPVIPAVIIACIVAVGVRRRRERNKESEDIEIVRRIKMEDTKNNWTSVDDPRSHNVHGARW